MKIKDLDLLLTQYGVTEDNELEVDKFWDVADKDSKQNKVVLGFTYADHPFAGIVHLQKKGLTKFKKYLGGVLSGEKVHVRLKKVKGKMIATQ